MQNEPITVKRIDELLHFLPLFEASGTQFVQRWAGGGTTEEGAITMPFPIYTEDVGKFFRLAGQPCWSDYGYNPRKASEMLDDLEFIERATLDEVKTMLTYCVRGERFSDGLWEAALKSGRITALLRRLVVLRRSIDHAEPSTTE